MSVQKRLVVYGECKSMVFLSTLLLTMLYLFFMDTLPAYAFVALGVVVWAFGYYRATRLHGIEFALIKILMMSIPLSFTDIFGQLQGGTLFTWFNLSLLVLTVVCLAKGLGKKRVTLSALSVLSLLTIFVSVVPLMNAPDFVDGLKQYVNILVALLGLVVGNMVKPHLTEREKVELRQYFVNGGIIAGVGVVVQFIMFTVYGQALGYLRGFGGFRTAYGFLFLDFSFLSLYLSAAAMVAFSMIRFHPQQSKRLLATMAFLSVASVATSARAGFVSSVVMILLATGMRVLALMPKKPIRSLLLMIVSAGFVIGGLALLTHFRPVGLSSDSGRSLLNKKAFEIFAENPLIGVGFGGGAYAGDYGVLPHNLIFQSLAQGGVLYTGPILLLMFAILYLSYRRKRDLFFVVATVVFGSLFIPNIFNSRFLSAILLLIGMSV